MLLFHLFVHDSPLLKKNNRAQEAKHDDMPTSHVQEAKKNARKLYNKNIQKTSSGKPFKLVRYKVAPETHDHI